MKSQFVTVGSITILSGILALFSYFLVGASVNFNFDFFSDPVLIFGFESVSNTMLRWSMITDIFGYYLLLLPLLFHIHHWMKDKSQWRDVITWCGSGYILLGAAGAAILAVVWNWSLEKYPSMDIQGKQNLELLFSAFSGMVYGGMWNLLNSFLMAVWMIGLGKVLMHYSSKTAWFTIIVGVCSLMDFAGGIFENKILSEIGLNLYLILAPLWAIIIGFKIRKNNSINQL